MPTIEIDLLFFIFTVLVAFLSLPFILGWTLWKSYRTPEFWLRLRRQDWVYILVRNPMMRLVQIALPLSKIGENGEFRIFKNRKYFWKEKDPKTGRATVFIWRNKKTGALYDWNDPMPQSWTPGQSLTSITDPKTLDDISEMKAMLMMLNADSMTQLMKISLVVSIVAVLAVAGLAFAVFSQTTSIDHLTRILGNFTRTGNP
jgi:hypothetical protein